jgi:hypothetical protein
MARAGKTALEIANELGVDKPTDEEKSQFVSQKASNYRKELRTDALAKAKEAELDEEATKALVEATTAKLPRLSKRTRTTDSFVDFLDELLAECDADPAEEGEESAEETATETPE